MIFCLLRLIEEISKKDYSGGSNIVVHVGQSHAKLLESRLIKSGFKLCEQYGNATKLSIDEDGIVTSQKMLGVEKNMNKSLTDVDTVIINFLFIEMSSSFSYIVRNSFSKCPRNILYSECLYTSRFRNE